jgi:RND family efflux transporter MFP subunit
MIKNKSFLIVSALILTAVFSYFFLSKGKQVLCTEITRGTIQDSVTGNVIVLAEQTYHLKSRAHGIVYFVAIEPLNRSIFVEKNQTLIQLDISDLNRSLEKALMEKKHFQQRIETGSILAVQLEIEKKELEAFTKLSNANKISLVDLSRKKNMVERLVIQVEQEKISNNEILINHLIRIEDLNSQIKKMTIRSPISGQFISSNVSTGSLVSLGHNFGTIISNKRLIEASLDEEDFVGLKEGLPAAVSLFSNGNKVLDAKVSRLSPTISSTTGRRLLYLEISDKNQTIHPGASGRVEIIKNRHKDRLLIPRKSLVGSSLFVVRKGKAFIKTVKTGARNLKMVEVIQGLKLNDVVVVETPHLLRDGQSIQPVLTNNIH